MRKITRFAALAAMVTFGVNCGGGDDGNGPGDPTPGTLIVSYGTPNSTDGAVKLVITSPVPPSAIALANSDLEFFHSGLSTSMTVVITSPVGNAVPAGPLLTLTVPDTRDAEDYSGAVAEVAQSAAPFTLRASLTGYDITIDAE